VPEPGNPQALNRYSYCYNNPLRYIDPTGRYSEDEIMKHFGVSSWEEVLALFGEGGFAWGWLYTLRCAQSGMGLMLFKDSTDREQATIYGYWTTRDGRIGFTDAPGSDTFCSADEAAAYANSYVWAANFEFRVYEPPWGLPIQYQYNLQPPGLIHLHSKHLVSRFKPEKVDLVGAGLDAAGIVIDLFSGGTLGKATNVAKLANTATKKGVSVASLGWDTLSVTSSTYTGETPSAWEAAGVLSDFAGCGPVPVVFDALGLICNFGNAGLFDFGP